MDFTLLFTLSALIHGLIIISVSVRIVMVRLPVSTSLAWMTLIFFLPLGGVTAYLVLGEKRLGSRFSARSRAVYERYSRWLKEVPLEIRSDPRELSSQGQSLNRLAAATAHLPALCGNRLQLLDTTESILSSIISDIDRARKFCHLEFYIWNEGGRADEAAAALLRAAARGVTCRVLLDAVGSDHFFKSRLAKQLKAGGVEMAVALPVSWMSLFRVRPDLRLHRKIVVIDDIAAYTGSFNLVDPRYFKQDSGVGEWVDAMVRIEGPGVHALNAIFRWDWELETGCDLDEQTSRIAEISRTRPTSGLDLQVIPSGPGRNVHSIYQILLMAIYSAQHEIAVTTPYFVPDEAVTTALLTAAERGVKVTLIVPERNDSRLVHYTCRSYFDDLLSAGVQIYWFKAGLLHTKCVVIDGNIALFGSVNLDIRSFWLDFEVTIGIYDPDFAQRLLALQEQYIQNSAEVNLEAWRLRPRRARFYENLTRLASPLL